MTAVTPSRRVGSSMPATRPRKLFREVPRTTGKPSPASFPSPSINSRLWVTVLPNPIPGSMATDSGLNPGVNHLLGLRSEERRDFADDIVIGGVALHGPRRPLHVHEDDSGDRLAKHIGHAGRGGGGHVVDDLSPGFEGGAGDIRLRGVDGHHGTVGDQGLQNGHHPAQLLDRRHRHRAGPGRLASDVEQIRSLLDHLPSGGYCGSRVEMEATIREGVRGDVDHSHDHAARYVQ